MFTMDDMNQMDIQTLTDTLESIFEHSSWIAEKAAALRPFSSLSDLHHKMASIVKAADRQTQLDLINKHPTRNKEYNERHLGKRAAKRGTQ